MNSTASFDLLPNGGLPSTTVAVASVSRKLPFVTRGDCGQMSIAFTLRPASGTTKAPEPALGSRYVWLMPIILSSVFIQLLATVGLVK